MCAAHARWMGLATVTDVLSQRYEPVPGDTAGAHGEIIVNAALAQELGPHHWGRTGPGAAACELALYVAHGCDHLMGADDATPTERARMRRRELRWLRDAADCGILDGLMPVRSTARGIAAAGMAKKPFAVAATAQRKGSQQWPASKK